MFKLSINLIILYQHIDNYIKEMKDLNEEKHSGCGLKQKILYKLSCKGTKQKTKSFPHFRAKQH